MVVDSAQSELVPPHDEVAERNVIGALMLNTDAFQDVIEAVYTADFYTPNYQTVFNAEITLFSEGKPIDQVTVADYLDKNGLLDKVGGRSALNAIVQDVVSTANVRYYAEIVHDRATLRNLISGGAKIQQLGYSSDGTDTKDIVNMAQETIFTISQDNEKSDYYSLNSGIDETLRVIDERRNNKGATGILTGFKSLDDDYLHGLKGGQMIVIAARPGVGKSTLSLDIARNAAFIQKKPVIIFNLEMGYTEIMMKIISAQKGIYHDKLIKGDLDDFDMQKIEQFVSETKFNDGSSVPLYIDDSANMSMVQIRTKCRKIAMSDEGLGLVIVDYLQLMSTGKRAENRQLEIAELSRKLKLLAKELNVPIIAISQLGRGSEKRDDKRPQLFDLRDSGAIEQDADVVLLIHREMRAKSDAESDDKTFQSNVAKGEAEIIVAKNRAGRQGNMRVLAQMRQSRFIENDELYRINKNGDSFSNIQVSDNEPTTLPDDIPPASPSINQVQTELFEDAAPNKDSDDNLQSDPDFLEQQMYGGVSDDEVLEEF